VNPSHIPIEQRARLLGEVRPLFGAALQKLWLPSAQLCVLQLRVPGRNFLVVVDARLAIAAVAPERPTAPDSSPKSQATLRAALTGARLDGARLELLDRAPLVRMSFSTPHGPRTLIAEQGAGLLLLGEAGKIVWAAASAGEKRRPGATYPTTIEAPGAPGGEEPSGAAAGEAPFDSAEIVGRAVAEEEARGLEARRRELAAQLKTRAQKLRRTLAAVEEDAARATRAEGDRHKAELLLPHQGRLPRGAKEARVPDWSQLDDEGQPREVVLALDPALSAAENAARWLKRSKRYQAAAGRIAARRAEVSADLARVESLRARAAAAPDISALLLVQGEEGPAGPAGKAASARGPRAGAPRPRLPYRSFRSTSGAQILVGRGARDNDTLTLRVARGNDVWLHARGVQGAHVILPGAGEAPDARALGEAALLAAHFSSARGADFAEVAWTRRKHVRKPKGAAPGAVLFSQEKTLRVRIDEAHLTALLRSEDL
jgi:predicted ribosome quality control (RQC) complex YloA/Tae2 family protein